MELDRKVAGYDIDAEVVETIKEKLGIGKQARLFGSNEFKVIIRGDAKHLRTELQRRVAGAKHE